MGNRVLPEEFFLRGPVTVARALLGKIIVRRTPRGRLAGSIVETEAYGQNDPASHAFSGLTPRNRVMFGPAGRTYVYFTYGMHHCFNLVTGPVGRAGAVLIRAVEPLDGIKKMQKNRGRKNILELAAGPARFAQAFGLSRRHNNLSAAGPEILLVDNQPQSFKIVRSARIGIRPELQPKLWRFYLKDNPFVSKINKRTKK